MVEQPAHGADVPHPGYAVELDGLVGEQAGGERRQGRVLGSARPHPADQPRRSEDLESVHAPYLPECLFPGYRRFNVRTRGIRE